MPNIKSAEKRVLQSEKSRLRNVARKSALKTAMKKVFVAVEAEDVESAQSLLREAQAQLSRAKGKGLLHKNTAARKASRLARKVAAVAKASASK